MPQESNEIEEARGGPPSPGPPSPVTAGSPWTKVFWLFVVLIVAGLVVFLSFVWLGKKGIDSAKEAAVEIAAGFKPEEVVETFEEWREMRATATDGNILEVATATASEKFTRRTHVEMFGRTLPLGTTASEITVPATYRYHIDLDDDWFVTSDGPRVLVLSPRIRPSLPVAFDTAGMRKKTKSGWARWDGTENLDELEKAITSKLAVRASDPEVLQEIRDESRVAVARFVRNWLLGQDAWAEGRFEEIVVVFEGEEGKNLSNAAAALELGNEEEPLP